MFWWFKKRNSNRRHKKRSGPMRRLLNLFAPMGTSMMEIRKAAGAEGGGRFQAPPGSRQYTVPECDYELIRRIRVMQALGEDNIIVSEIQNERQAFFNARILYDWYGIDADELLQLTGFTVDSPKLLNDLLDTQGS